MVIKNIKITAIFKEFVDQFSLDPKTGLVFHATIMDLYPDVDTDLPINYNSLTKQMIVADVIPNSPKTKFLKNCLPIGCQTIDGLGMIVSQDVTFIEH